MDFDHITTASKSEQIRAWSIDRAQEGLRNQGPIRNDDLIARADKIEQYVLNGKQSDND